MVCAFIESGVEMEVMKLNRPRNDIVKPFSCDIPVEEEMTLDYFQFRVVFVFIFVRCFLSYQREPQILVSWL